MNNRAIAMSISMMMMPPALYDAATTVPISKVYIYPSIDGGFVQR